MTDALKALGERTHANKSAASVLLTKAQKAFYKDDALNTANELKRFKQWAEAEEAYRLVINVTGETESLKKSIEVCRENLEAENEGLKIAHDLFKAKKWQQSIDAYNKAAETLGTLRPIREGINDAKLLKPKARCPINCCMTSIISSHRSSSALFRPARAIRRSSSNST